MTNQPPNFAIRRQRGAALLMLLGVLGVGGASLFLHNVNVRQTELNRQKLTAMQLGNARDALIGFALRHGRLPRPAISTRDGHESPVPCEDAAACTGLLPWLSLGIPATDGWGRQLHYSVTPIMSSHQFSATLAVADKRIFSRDSRGELVLRRGRPQCGISTQCLPAIVFSSGARNQGISASGQSLNNSTADNTDERYNASASNDFVARIRSSDPADSGGEFDDMLVWVPLVNLYQQMARAGALR